MKDIKKETLTSDQDVITMTFDDNPNIPTANYNDETAKNIQKAIMNKLKTEKLKRLVEQELKEDSVEETNPFSMNFKLKGL